VEKSNSNRPKQTCVDPVFRAFMATITPLTLNAFIHTTILRAPQDPDGAAKAVHAWR
jgi:hypothetical protein